MNSTLFYILCAFTCVFAGCGKTLPPSTDIPPELYFSGTLDGQSSQWVAGQDGLVADARFETDGLGVAQYEGAFQPNGCVGCPGSILITLRGASPDQGPQPAVDLLPGKRTYLGNTTGNVLAPADPKAFRFQATSQGLHPMRYIWEVEGKTYEGSSSFFHSFQRTGHQSVKLHTTDARGCENMTEFKVPAGQGFCGAPFRFNYQKQANGSIHFQAPVDIDSADIQFVTWNFGDGNAVLSSTQAVHTYAYPGIYPVKVIVMDAEGCLHCDFQNVYTGQGSACTSSMLALPVSPQKETTQVSIQYWDESGRMFWSDHLRGQPSESTFEIISAEPYINDPDGTPSWRLGVTFRCTLYPNDGGEDALIIQSDETFVAVGVE